MVDELTKFGLQRIDTLVGPAMAEVTAMLELLRERRDQLEAAIGNVADLATRIALVVEDRALDGELLGLLGAIRAREWTLYGAD